MSNETPTPRFESSQDKGESTQTSPPTSSKGPPQNAVVRYDTSHALPLYSNSFVITGTPEEVILDFGLNPTQFSLTIQPVRVNQQIVLNYFTAKRLLTVLQVVVQKHESSFGVIEPDVSKRQKGGG